MPDIVSQPDEHKKPRLFSGMQPSSDSLHLGNYLGALRNWVSLQESHTGIFCVVDLHAITVPQDPKQLRKNVKKTAAQYIASGIDPEKSILFVQSEVPEHSQLAWLLSTMTGFGEASRMTQFKDKTAKTGSDSATVGLFTYPILMAADILLYKTQLVPVGDDQRQHLELTRDLAQRFNSRFGKTFPIPEAFIPTQNSRVYDVSRPGAKMSKSAESEAGLIKILDEPAVTAKKIRQAVTDDERSIRFDPSTKPGISNLLTIHHAFSAVPLEKLVDDYAGRGYGDLKSDVASLVNETLAPIRERCFELLEDDTHLTQILDSGAEKARTIAASTLAHVNEAFGLAENLCSRK